MPQQHRRRPDPHHGGRRRVEPGRRRRICKRRVVPPATVERESVTQPPGVGAGDASSTPAAVQAHVGAKEREGGIPAPLPPLSAIPDLRRQNAETFARRLRPPMFQPLDPPPLLPSGEHLSIARRKPGPLTTADTPEEPSKNRKRTGRRRANGEGSIFPYRNGYAAYVWVTTPAGERRRKWVYGKNREETHGKYIQLLAEAKNGRVTTKIPTVGNRVAYWLEAVVVEPDYAPLSIVTCETFARLYIVPFLGKKRLDKLSVRDVREWVNKLRRTCQCCAQGKDARRPVAHWNPQRRRHCCAVGKCCGQVLSEATVQKALKTLRAILSNAVMEEVISKNVAASVRVSTPRKRKDKPWTADEARRFLESAQKNDDPLYAAFVLILVLGLRKGEVLGLDWKYVDLDAGEIYVGEQLQRVRRALLRREVKTEDSEAPLPLPAICTAALRLRKQRQERDAENHPDWPANGLVFTRADGSAIEPAGGFNRRFDAAIARAGARRITVHATRGTCATLLAALDVHPRVAMRILRHSNIKMTMEVYTDATDAAVSEALKRLGSALTTPEDGA